MASIVSVNQLQVFNQHGLAEIASTSISVSNYTHINELDVQSLSQKPRRQLPVGQEKPAGKHSKGNKLKSLKTRDQIACEENMCFDPRPVILNLAYFLGIIAIGLLMYALIKTIQSLTEINQTRRVRTTMNTENETENAMMSERKQLVPNMGGQSSNANLNHYQGLSPRINHANQQITVQGDVITHGATNVRQMSPRGIETHTRQIDTETIKPDIEGQLDLENVGFNGRSPSPRQRGEKQKGDRGQSIFTDTGNQDLYQQPIGKIELPLEELGSQKSMDDSQKKAPRKGDRNNTSKQIFDHNDEIGLNIDTEQREPVGNYNRFTEGIELDNIYNDEKPITKNIKKQTKLAIYSGRDNISSQRNNEFREPMPQSGRFEHRMDNGDAQAGPDISLSSNDATHLVNIPKNIGP